MNPINRRLELSALLQTSRWHAWFVACIVLSACGGRGQDEARTQSPGGGRVSSKGGAGGDAGGTSSSGSAGLGGTYQVTTSSTGGVATHAGSAMAQAGGMLAQAGSTGSAIAQAGNAGSVQVLTCDSGALRTAVEAATFGPNTHVGWCWLSLDPAEADHYGGAWGTVTIDDEGRPVCHPGRLNCSLQQLADDGWTCIERAGWTYVYWCEYSM
jgi:hypothetical protein